MNPSKVDLDSKTKIPQRYLPKHLTKKDRSVVRKNLIQSRKLYKTNKYFVRPKVKSFKSRKSNHLNRLKNIYGVKNALPSKELSEKTKCSLDVLQKIVKKGEGAYLSSGSRPNQTPQSWGVARLASALTGGNASVVDYNILEKGCKPTSKVLKLAKKQCKKVGRKCGNNKTKNKKNKKNKTLKMKGGDDDLPECSICWNPLENNQEKFICEGDPRHVFHTECIRQYCRGLYGVRVFPCPICRYDNNCPRDDEAPPLPPMFINGATQAQAEAAAERNRERAAARTARRTAYETAVERRRETERAAAERNRERIAQEERRRLEEAQAPAREAAIARRVAEIIARRGRPQTIPPPVEDINIYLTENSISSLVRADTDIDEIINNFFFHCYDEEEHRYNPVLQRNAFIPTEDNTLTYIDLLSNERHGNEEPFSFYNGDEQYTDAEVDEILNNIGQRRILMGGDEYTTYVDAHTHYYLALFRFDENNFVSNIWAIYGPGGVIENYGGQPLLRSREEVNANPPPVYVDEQNNNTIFNFINNQGDEGDY